MKRLYTIQLLSSIFVTAIALVATLFINQAVVLAAAEPGCYKIDNGQPTKLDCPTTGAVYDDGSGANLIGPQAGRCYVYAANLYDGDISFGDPYVDVSCETLSGCPENQELRYSDTAGSAPQCVDKSTATSGQYVKAGPVEVSGTRKEVLDNCKDPKSCVDTNPIFVILTDALNFLSALVGIVVIGSIILGGIQYSASHGDPGAVAKAKKRIVNALLAFVSYIFLYAFLQWLIPGGPF